jgi:protein subunit release factor A
MSITHYPKGIVVSCQDFMKKEKSDVNRENIRKLDKIVGKMLTLLDEFEEIL